MITTNFSEREVTFSTIAERNGLVQDQIARAKQFERNINFSAERLQAIRNSVNIPILVNSWLRSPKVNGLVGGSPTSAHQYGLAVDVEIEQAIPWGLLQILLEEHVDSTDHENIGAIYRNSLGANHNWFLGLVIACNLEHFEVDQLIFEYGSSLHNPAWIHVGFGRPLHYNDGWSDGVVTPPRHQILRIWHDGDVQKQLFSGVHGFMIEAGVKGK